MATILLSAAGAALGSGIGGSALGLSGAVVGRAIGGSVGRNIDQRILGAGSDAVEVGRVERFHIAGAGYGAPIKQVWGRMRIAAEIIWASRFKENRSSSTGGKGSPRSTTENFSYTVSIALALCEGPALRVGRIWSDGVEIAPSSLNIRFYTGSEDQLPDSKIEAVEGVGFAPSYRGIAYVVIEDLALARFGNRVPQFSFEVVRRAKTSEGSEAFDLPATITAVSMIPGSGEYALATTPVHFNYGLGRNRSTNVHSIHGGTDFIASLEQLTEELPFCKSVSLVVSWFGSDLRCGTCLVQPKVEQRVHDGVEMPWSVSGVNRQSANTVPEVDGRPIYGGTPTDTSIVEAIRAVRSSGKEVMFYPFILMDQTEFNGLPDPWSQSENQPILPWRGRITLNHAPGRFGTSDQTMQAEAEVASFLGDALPEHFLINENSVNYVGPPEWGYRRFILHYANLCKIAGGVDAFCVGSELRGLTQIRSGLTTFPMVEALRRLANEVKEILGSGTKVSYAADWSEYFGYHVNNDVIFHLDTLWSDGGIDFIGIDNYMPVSDWREEPGHLDEDWGSIYNLDYLESNIAGGEGFDWYYDSFESELSQKRTPIQDQVHNEAWVFKYKDLKSWWSNSHHNRINGVRNQSPTDWVPGMKPIVFTEYGCAALDKATNQPNRFLDAKSSESSLPRSSSGSRDDFIQVQYFNAMRNFWLKIENNPKSNIYQESMVDFGHSHAWAWDARPFPDFPGNTVEWSDGFNYTKGHWLNGRCSSQPIAMIVSEICNGTVLTKGLNTDGLEGLVRGFTVDSSYSARAKIQSLMLAYGFCVRESESGLEFFVRKSASEIDLSSDHFAFSSTVKGDRIRARTPDTEALGKTRLTYIEAENDFAIRSTEGVSERSHFNATQAELQIQLTEPEANNIVDRWLSELSFAHDSIQFLLPNSFFYLLPGDAVMIDGQNYKVDQVEVGEAVFVDAVRTNSRGVEPAPERGSAPLRLPFVPSTPIFALFLDLPLLQGDEVPHAPHIAVSAAPWPGDVAVWSSSSDSGFVINQTIEMPSILGVTLSNLPYAPPGLWDQGSRVVVEIETGALASATMIDVLNGANVVAIGDGSPENWEILQFATATLVGENRFELSTLLRGSAGTDAIMPTVWPVGSFVVLLDNALSQVSIATSNRSLPRHYRVGALDRGYSNSNVVELSQSFDGLGLRPYSVSHLLAKGSVGQIIRVEWIRRTRIDGDSWSSVEVPLGEEIECYLVVVSVGMTEVRRTEVSIPAWVYTAEMQSLDGVSGPFKISVAQKSTTFGFGPFRSLVF